MPEIQFGAEAYENESYGLPPLKLENWFAEETGDRQDWGHRLIPTPGLAGFSDNAGSAGRGCFQSDAIASGQIIQVFGTSVRRVASTGITTPLTGAVTNDAKPTRFALSQAEAVLNSGGDVYLITASDATDFTAQLTSAGASGDIIDVASLNNRHLYVEDNSGRLFYSTAGDADDIAGFITAEADPDQLRAAMVVGGSLLLLGTRKTELWIGTDSTTTPLIPRQGYILDVGIISSDAKCVAGGIGFWVGHDATVYQWAGGREQRVSAHWMERAIQGLSAANKALIRMSAHNWSGHKFAKVYIPTVGDFFFDTLTQRWHRRKDLDDENAHWGFDYFVEAFGETYVQKLSNGVLYHLDGMTFTEDAQAVRRVATALVPVKREQAINNLIIEGQSGVGLDQTSGQGADPKCMLRIAYDGRTFEGEHIREIGKSGEFRWRPVFGPLGQARPPCVVAEVAYSDPVGWSVYGASFNESAG